MDSFFKVLRLIIIIISIILIYAYCHRKDMDKNFIQTSVDYIYDNYEYVDSVFNKKN